MILYCFFSGFSVYRKTTKQQQQNKQESLMILKTHITWMPWENSRKKSLKLFGLLQTIWSTVLPLGKVWIQFAAPLTFCISAKYLLSFPGYSNLFVLHWTLSNLKTVLTKYMYLFISSYLQKKVSINKWPEVAKHWFCCFFHIVHSW